MLPNVQQKTIKPFIEQVSKGTLIYTDEYAIYSRLEAWGYAQIIRQASMRETKRTMAFTKCMSIRGKVFGLYYVLGYARIGNFPCIWDFLSSFIMLENADRLY
jgi:hypothetical protein